MVFISPTKRSISTGSSNADNMNTTNTANNTTATTNSSNNATTGIRQLIRPSTHIPWAVDVVSAVPQAVGTSSSLLASAITAASCPGWACMASADGYVHVWQPRTTSLAEQRVQQSKDFLKLYLPDMKIKSSSNTNNSTAQSAATKERLFLELRPFVGDRGDAVHFFAAHSTTGVILLRKVTRTDLRTSLPLPGKMAKARIDLEDGERITTMSTTTNGMIAVVGTSFGNMFWITHTLVPSSLHVQKIEDNTSSPGIFSRLASGLVSTVSTSYGSNSNDKSTASDPPICQILLHSTPDEEDGSYNLHSVDQAGNIVQWTITPSVAAAHHATFAGREIGNILSIQRQQQRQTSNSNHVDDWLVRDGSMVITVIQATRRSPRSMASSSSLEDDDTDQDCIHAIVRANRGAESRLYWLETMISTAASTDTNNYSNTTANNNNINTINNNSQDGQEPLQLQRACWLSRFAVPLEVRVLGLLATDNGTVYAAFYSTARNSINHRTNIIMALSKDPTSIVQEVDLPTTQIPALLPNAFSKDKVTHGCTAIATSGVGIRIRFLPPKSRSMSPLKRQRSGDTGSSVAAVQTLLSHLRSIFWQAYQDGMGRSSSFFGDRLLPPSLTQASPEDLELAAVAFATELQHKVDKSSAQNPLEWHSALIQLLQHGGLYRSLSACGRYQLLTIGQELAVFHALNAAPISRVWQQEQLASFQSHGIADWLLEVQTREEQANWPHASEWNAWLCQCLEIAASYRQDRAIAFYDVADDQPYQEKSIRPFLSHESMQSVLLRQINYFRTQISSGVALDADQVEVVVRAILQSFAESCNENNMESKKYYGRVKKLSISLLRTVNDSNDEVAFELCVEYAYFGALCQISVDHHKRRDASLYSLEAVWDEISQLDLLTGFTFPQYALQWHVDKGMYGHVLNYGRRSPEDLNVLLIRDERLLPYRWIHNVRQGDYTQATESLLLRCSDKNTGSSDIDGSSGDDSSNNNLATLKNHLWSLSMAKLSQKLDVHKSNSAVKRGQAIERKLELINAQQMLLGDADDENDGGIANNDTASEGRNVLSPQRLVQVTQEKLRRTEVKAERVRLCFIGLVVCSCMEDPALSQTAAAELWAYCLWCDTNLWLEWIRTQTDLTDAGLRQLASQFTIFGQVLNEVQNGISNDGANAALKAVCYGKHIEGLVLDKWGHSNSKAEMSRLLHSVSYVPTKEMKAMMLVSGTF